MKLIKTFIICLVISGLLFSFTACSMDKCSKEIMDPTATPYETNSPATNAPTPSAPQTTDGLPEGTDNARSRTRDDLIHPTDFVEDFFNGTNNPDNGHM